MVELFCNLDRVHIMSNDMIITAFDDADHDLIFCVLLLELTPDGTKADPTKLKAVVKMPAPTNTKAVHQLAVKVRAKLHG